MGLISVALSSVGGNLADQWKEYFYCDAIDKDVLAVRGQKRTSGGNKGNDNIISNGSGIVVADGQCMIIVDQGKVVEVCAEPGKFTYDTSSSPSIFAGSFGQSLLDSLKDIGERIAFGGDAAKDQRVYYFNTKEILDNKVGTPSPVPFRVIDNNIGLDMEMGIRMNAIYTYRITNPVLFYTNVCGNFQGEYSRSELDQTLKSEILAALQPALAKISAMGVRYSEIPAHALEFEAALKEVLEETWTNTRGITIAKFNPNTINLSDEDAATIKELQRAKVLGNATLGAGYLAGAQGQAMQDAAKNTAGAATGFIGMGMAQNMGGMNAASLYGIAAQQQAAAPAPAPAGNAWTCSCGTTNTGKFCSNCGTPAPAANWTCSCGTVNTGKFCSNCGTPRP